MVTCKLRGGLGNQMFQIGATIGLAKKHGVDFFIPRMTEDNDIRVNSNYMGRFQHLPQLRDSNKQLHVYNEPSFGYNEIPYCDGICLNGYFQSEKYFDHCRQDIIEAFSPITRGLGYEIGFCSIHVRRGDYLNLSDYHTNLTMDYYTKAIEYIKQNTSIKKFMIFSDDIAWCKENFIGNEFNFCTNGNEIEEMSIMTNYCIHHIIANSSFSWWGSWLGAHEDKIIVAPQKWFGEKFGDRKSVV